MFVSKVHTKRIFIWRGIVRRNAKITKSVISPKLQHILHGHMFMSNYFFTFEK